MTLEIEKITKTYGSFKAVDAVSCTFKNGVYGLLGTNGAGKTTLMRMITTLMRPDSGSIRWNGRDIFAMDAAFRAQLGYLPQDFGCYPEFTVRDYLLYIAAIKGMRPAIAKQRTALLLDQVGLSKSSKQRMKTLSGGMKRRAGIAQAMLNDPKLLVLDEPTAGLDPSERVRFRNLLSALSADRVVLLSTHIVSDVESIADEIMMMQGGRIIASGAPETVAAIPEGVWRVHASRREAEEMQRRHRVVNVKNVPDGAELRIISLEKPALNAVPEAPGLEDAFLYYFGEGAEKHDSL